MLDLLHLFMYTTYEYYYTCILFWRERERETVNSKISKNFPYYTVKIIF